MLGNMNYANCRRARAWAVEELKRAHIDSPALTADLLLGFVLGWDRVRLLSHAEQEMEDDSWDRLRRLIHRRANGEPLQYLTGEQEFYGLAFKVTPAVLIPRPETEILVEKAIELIRHHAPPMPASRTSAPVPAASPYRLRTTFPHAAGWAVDLSAVALKIARENAKRHGVENRIGFVQSDLLECFPKSRASISFFAILLMLHSTSMIVCPPK